MSEKRIERLRMIIDGLEAEKLALLATVDALTEENGKLRAALKVIAVGTDRDNFPLMDSELRHIAMKALEVRGE